MSRPKGSAQFEGDTDKAVKEFLRNATPADRDAAMEHVERVCDDISEKMNNAILDAFLERRSVPA